MQKVLFRIIINACWSLMYIKVLTKIIFYGNIPLNKHVDKCSKHAKKHDTYHLYSQ